MSRWMGFLAFAYCKSVNVFPCKKNKIFNRYHFVVIFIYYILRILQKNSSFCLFIYCVKQGMLQANRCKTSATAWADITLQWDCIWWHTNLFLLHSRWFNIFLSALIKHVLLQTFWLNVKQTKRNLHLKQLILIKKADYLCILLYNA